MEKKSFLQCLLLFMHFGGHFSLELKSETDPVKGATVKLVCTIDPLSFTNFISLFKDGNIKTSCDNANACSPTSTDSNRYQYTSNSSAVTVEISSLNHASDAGAWRCTIGGSSSDYTLVVQSIPSTLTLQTIPVANVTKDISDVQVSATCYCIYPAVTEIDILYRTKPTEDFKVLERIPPASLSTTANPGHSCLAHEFQITVSNYSVSVENNPVALSDQNDVYFKVQFGNSITGAVGPFDFIVKTVPPGACTGSFHCGFWLLLLAVVTSIIILILMWRKVKRFGFSASGFSKMKIGITGVFSFVAVGIGLGLGFGLQAGQANCLECGATIGISIALGVALSVIQFIVIINCDKEKGCDGNSKGFSLDNCFRKCSVKPDVDKKTPASATGINLETKKKSQNKPTEKGTEASSLTAKTFGQPLPDTPKARKHQLEPLKTDSFEVENSTTEKKKKKKRKKKKETSEGNEASEEKEERPELEF